jgi:Helix-turn-helix domain
MEDLRALRKRRGLSLEALGYLAGVDQATSAGSSGALPNHAGTPSSNSPERCGLAPSGWPRSWPRRGSTTSTRPRRTSCDPRPDRPADGAAVADRRPGVWPRSGPGVRACTPRRTAIRCLPPRPKLESSNCSTPACPSPRPGRRRRVNYPAMRYVASDDCKVKGPGRAVLWVIAYHADRDTGECWVGQRRLARESGFARSTVQRALDELFSGGVLEYVEDHRGPKARPLPDRPQSGRG